MVNIVETNLTFGALTRRTATRRIIIHHTASADVSAADVHGWHRARGWSGNGYHYLIRRDGTIERGRPEAMVGSHALGANHDSIGIALTGHFENAPPAAAQIDAVVALIRDIHTRHGVIPVVGHRDVRATECPGSLFPLERVKQMVAQPIAPLAVTPPPPPPRPIRLQINGRDVAADLKLEGGRTYILLDGVPPERHWVQVRAFAGILGATLQWDVAARVVRLTVLP